MRLLLVLVLVACVTPSDPIEPQVTSGVIQVRFPIVMNRQLDMLLVIDSSPAMAPHVDNVRTNLRRFRELMSALPAVPDLRLGVVTTDVAADDAVLRGTPGLSGNFVVDRVGDDGVRLRNYAGDLGEVVARLGDVGTSGGRPRPLAAARRALENPANRGFLRDDAATAIYFITASDTDEDIEGYVQFFKGLHIDPSEVIVGGALGAGERMPAFLARFPNRNTRVSIDDPDWSRLFGIFIVKTTLGARCIGGPLLDLDPIAPGPQHACAVWYDFPIGGEVIRPCSESLAGTCWKIVPDPVRCPLAEGILEIEQPPELPDRVMLNADCLSR